MGCTWNRVLFLKKVHTSLAVFPGAGFREAGRWMEGRVSGSAPSGASRTERQTALPSCDRRRRMSHWWAMNSTVWTEMFSSQSVWLSGGSGFDPQTAPTGSLCLFVFLFKRPRYQCCVKKYLWVNRGNSQFVLGFKIWKNPEYIFAQAVTMRTACNRQNWKITKYRKHGQFMLSLDNF